MLPFCSGFVISFNEDALKVIIKNYTREAGLRNLERQIATVCRKVARKIAEGSKKKKFLLLPTNVHKYLGAPKFLEEEREKELPPGVALGLAWTPAGGEILHIEVLTMPGKGKLILTS